MKAVKPSSFRPFRSPRLRALDAAGLWVIADQAVASMGNFLTGVLLVRHLLPQSQYGAWGLILETMFFLNALQSALINYPMTIEATSLDRSAPQKATSAALLFTLVLLPILGLAMFFAAGATAGLAVGTMAVIAMILWQTQETLRRSLIAVLRVADCIPGDAISYLGQALGVFLLIRAGRLSLVSALIIVAGTSAIAIVVQAMQTGLAPIRSVHFGQLARRFWSLGRWNLLAAMTTLITVASFPWVLRIGSGLQAVAVLMALSLPLKLTNPVMNSIGGLVIPAVSRRMREHGARNAVRPAIRYGAIGLLLLLPCYLVAVMVPAVLLRIVFGPASPYVRDAGLMRIWAFSWVATYLSVVLGAVLLGLHQSRLHFAGQVVRAVAVAVIALPAGFFFGVRGLVTGAVGSSAVDLFVGAMLVRYALRVLPINPPAEEPCDVPSPTLHVMPTSTDEPMPSVEGNIAASVS